MLCFGPDRGRNVTYSHPCRWLPGFRPADGAAALRTLVTRYLYAYGPATPQHFAKWLGIPSRYAAGLFGKLGGALEHVEVDGEPGSSARDQDRGRRGGLRQPERREQARVVERGDPGDA